MEETIDKKAIGKHSVFEKIIPYIFLFFIFSFLGWVLETIFCISIYHNFEKRGFLYSPICPIYRNWRFHLDFLFR